MRLRPALLLTALLVLLATTLPSQAAPAPERTLPSLAAISDIKGVVSANAYRPTALLAPEIARLQSIGVNHVTLYVYLVVDSPTASSVQRRPSITATDAELTTVIDLAHSAGMTVAVAPLPFWAGGSMWRGEFEPEDPDAFFDSWRFQIEHYAELSERNGVELFSIGSEQNSLQSRTEQWRRTADTAREKFSGPLTYLATGNDSINDIAYWDALDVVSASLYFPVSDRARPTYDEIRGTWQGYAMSMLRDLAADTGRKVFIAETGYVSAEFFGKTPANPRPTGIPAPLAQAEAYAAVLDAIEATADRSSFLLGIAWWDWDSYTVTPLDTTFSPRGKPAECVLAQKWASGVVQTVAGALPCARR